MPGSQYTNIFMITPSNGWGPNQIFNLKPNQELDWLVYARTSPATRIKSDGSREEMAAGIPLLDYGLGSDPYWLFQPTRANLIVNPAIVATQNCTVAASQYTLSFFGTGSITLSGTHVAVLNGTGADDVVSLTFTPTAGTLTLTVAGTATDGNLELGGFRTNPILTSPRVFDTATRSDLIVDGMLSPDGGTINITLRNVIDGSGGAIGARIGDVGGTAIEFGGNGANNIFLWKRIGGTQTAIGATPTNAKLNLAFTINATTLKVFCNGSKIYDITGAFDPSDLTSFLYTGQAFMSYVNNPQFYPTILTEVEANALTLQ